MNEQNIPNSEFSPIQVLIKLTAVSLSRPTVRRDHLFLQGTIVSDAIGATGEGYKAGQLK